MKLWRGVGWQHDFSMDNTALAGVVVGQAVPLVHQLFAAPIGGSSHGGLALAPLDDLDGTMKNCRKNAPPYSMDCSPGIENHAMFLVQSPEDLIIREIDEAAEELLLEHLAEAVTHLSPTQARRLYARYALKKKFREIAADEGISGSCACDSVTGALKKLQKIFAKNGWLEKED